VHLDNNQVFSPTDAQLDSLTNNFDLLAPEFYDYHHDTKVKPEAATAVIELLVMGGKTPETC